MPGKFNVATPVQVSTTADSNPWSYEGAPPVTNIAPVASPFDAGIAQAQAQATADAAKVKTDQEAAQKAIDDKTKQAADYAATSAYPTFPNSLGLGTQVLAGPTQEFGRGNVSGGMGANQPQGSTQPPSNSGTRGFNPWSVIGEANAS